MKIDILTVLPEMVTCALDHSIVKRARDRGLITINVVNLRDFTFDRHKTTDDIPYGGGGGMVMKIEPIARALAFLTQDFETNPAQNAVNEVNYSVAKSVGENETEAERGALSQRPDAAVVFAAAEAVTEPLSAPIIGSRQRPRIVITDPRGPRFTQAIAQQWAQEEHLILLCGHYEGIDERVRQHLATDEISVGDYILTGGELPALLIADALTRLQPDALGDAQAPDKDTFADDLLEYPHYTRPRDFQGWVVPDILLCGHHAQIERWRHWHQLRATRARRPDLFARLNLTDKDWKLLNGEEPTAPPDSKATAHPQPAPGTAQLEQAAPDESRSAEISSDDAAAGPETSVKEQKEDIDGFRI